MKVLAKEEGKRPYTMTKARKYAPAAVIHLGRLLETEDFADSAVILLDWDGDLFLEGLPKDMQTPTIHIIVEKFYPQYKKNNRLSLDAHLDVEEMFGHDNATPDDLREVVESFKTQVEKQEARRRTR